MVFEWAGVRYDTAEMTPFNTGARHEPVVFSTPDGQCLFVQTMDRTRGVTIHRAAADEVRRLAERYGQPKWLSALHHADDPEACRV